MRASQQQRPSSTARVVQSLTNIRPSQLLLAVPLILTFYALVLRSRISEPYDVFDPTLPLDSSVFSEERLIQEARDRPTVGKLLHTTGRKNLRPAGLSVPWNGPEPDSNGPKIAFCVTTSEPLSAIQAWLQYNRAIGVSKFYLFVQGRAALPGNVEALRGEHDVHVILYDDKLKAIHASSRIWNEGWLSAFFHKPCNHELFVLQSLNMEEAIKLARADGMEWLLHIDTDELVYPAGTRSFSLQETLAGLPDNVDTVVFPNYEGLPERDDVAEPFVEVTLFKRNFAHILSEQYFKYYSTVAHGNPNYYITYANGKAAARIQPGLRPNGAHRWHNYGKRGGVVEVTADSAAVLHYTYDRFQDLKSRRDRCDCAPTEDDAKRCFILPFDRMAFLEASLKPDAELRAFFRDHLVWDNATVVNDLLHRGLFARIHEPQLLIRGMRRAAGAAGSRGEARGNATSEATGDASVPVTTADPAADKGTGSTAAAEGMLAAARNGAGTGNGAGTAAPKAIGAEATGLQQDPQGDRPASVAAVEAKKDAIATAASKDTPAATSTEVPKLKEATTQSQGTGMAASKVDEAGHIKPGAGAAAAKSSTDAADKEEAIALMLRENKKLAEQGEAGAVQAEGTAATSAGSATESNLVAAE